MRLVLIIVMAGLVCSCGPNKAERAARFAARCQNSGFTIPQCQLLFEIVEKAASDSDDAAVFGAVALALSSTRK